MVSAAPPSRHALPRQLQPTFFHAIRQGGLWGIVLFGLCTSVFLAVLLSWTDVRTPSSRRGTGHSFWEQGRPVRKRVQQLGSQSKETMRSTFHDNMTKLEEKLSNESVVWPTLFLIGAPKAASSTFHDLLVQHPQLCTARSSRAGRPAKEVGTLYTTKIKVFLLSLYGRSPGGHDARCQELAKKGSTDFRYMDNHPIYLHGFEQKMKAVIPAQIHEDLRFIIVLREPVSRSLSQFNHQRAADCQWWCEHGVLDQQHFALEFNASADFVSRSMYAADLRPWFHAFPRKQFLVLSTDQLLWNTSDTLSRVAIFLGLDPLPWAHVSPIQSSSSRRPAPAVQELKRRPSAPEPHETRKLSVADFSCAQLQRFVSFFAPHNQDLYRLLQSTHKDAPDQQPPFSPFADPRPSHCQSAPSS